MDENLKKTLEVLLEGVKSTGNFAVEQAPILVKEILWWGVGKAVFWIVLCWAVAAVGQFYFLPKVRAYAKEDDSLEAGSFAVVLRLLFPVLAIGAAGVNGYTLVQIWLAPRLYLIETLARMVSK